MVNLWLPVAVNVVPQRKEPRPFATYREALEASRFLAGHGEPDARPRWSTNGGQRRML